MIGFLLTEAQRNILADYLSQRPWREVNPLLVLLDQLPPVPPPSKEKVK